MTTAGTVTEVTELTGVDLEGTPPCTCVRRLTVIGRVLTRQCGRPSAVRVRVHCLACGRRDSAFLCRRHARYFADGRIVRCRYCGEVGKCRSTES